MGQAVSTLAQAYLVDANVFTDMVDKISGTAAIEMMNDSQMSTMSRFTNSLASGYASVKGFTEDFHSSSEFMRTVRPQATGGFGPRLQSRTISSRLAQECQMPPLSLFESTHGPSLRPKA